jgi:hypothetical protein
MLHRLDRMVSNINLIVVKALTGNIWVICALKFEGSHDTCECDTSPMLVSDIRGSRLWVARLMMADELTRLPLQTPHRATASLALVSVNCRPCASAEIG